MVNTAATIPTEIITPLRAGERVEPTIYHRIRQRLILHGCKWDPQVGDVETIGRFPLILPASQWQKLSSFSELLAEELMTAELELLGRPDLHHRLGLPRGLRQVLKLANRKPATPAAARVLRFDFHWTDQGWKISEVNSDVPGGFCEASELPALMAEHFPGTVTAGHPGSVWADAIAANTLANKPVALLTAPGYMEDRQVLAYLAQRLDDRGIATVWTQPNDLRWSAGRASAICFNTGMTPTKPVSEVLQRSGFLAARSGSSEYLRDRLEVLKSSPIGEIQLGAIIRFYQAEWLLAKRVPELFVGGKTPVGNPGVAALTESKRFPLVWRLLQTRLPTWAALLPETRDPREVSWQSDESWLVKTAMCNTGDTVAICSLMTTKQWNKVRREVWWRPGTWIAQRRFNASGIESPAGPIYPCVGVYTINGKTAGIYGRYSHRPLIDYTAVDVAVLIEQEAGTP